ncbi:MULTISPECIES: DUF6285 domain-containing protein [Thermomonospora]|uniref:DUF6285 domain-containing protein n=1 Tax=Thermomonospora curvata (strain ATCC 19995 / DSM 43183 / JCM 3096 / KCTC 9072 / NBRC 15933 / NCIMB 10081 / Henssen B9) TaxID=471852 RepID=D1A3Y7_THECD|nr:MULTISPECIES: DUF6285 domain-containing protein [Thermomonospora]ACY98040.1 conserved hypothetical protein [Thermomonospora curvata DSM 43183]PKK14315.1 MAG: hypothetical protein BUE48_012130 [Thermomonospora sp. CIF 1]
MAPPHDAPSAGELIAAVREFLQGEILPALEGRTRFHGLVAVNVLGMVERELALGPAHQQAHRERLAALGFADDAALAAAIRAGELDDRYAEVKAALLDAVRDKLAVANPGYADS